MKTTAQLISQINRVERDTDRHYASQQLINSGQRAAPSEGWETAARLNQIWNNSRRQTSMTPDPFRLSDGAAHPVKTAACSFGDCQQDPNCAEHCPDKPKPAATTARTSLNCGPGVCEGKASCADRHCHGHPLHPSQQDHTSRSTFWPGYLIAGASVAAWIVITVYQAR